MVLKYRRLDDYRWEIRREGKMRVPARIYASKRVLTDIRKDNSPEQVVNVAHLPGILKYSLAMPDMHWGYGFPIGGVAAFDQDEGVISPGGVGYDINCGVRLLRTALHREDVEKHVEDLSAALFRAVPSGLGSKSHRKLSAKELKRVLRDGAGWAVKNGFGYPEDLEHCEEEGAIDGADPSALSDRARDRGRPQLGSLGSGNHFCELGVVAEIFEPDAAAAFGLTEGQVTIMLHSGSRGLGYQVCDDSLRTMLKASQRYGIELPDRQLCAAPLGSPEAEQYFGAMACAINYAFANRQMMTQFIRTAMSEFFRCSDGELGIQLVYDICHNIAKWETHDVDGEKRRVCVHRKGATRAFGPGHRDIPQRYRDVGQPVLIPGDMGRYSYVLAGTDKAMKETFGSSCHGAGRLMSRNQAKKLAKGRSIFAEMRDKGIILHSQSRKTVAEEIPEAYKDVADIVDVMHGAGITRKVAKLVPLAVIKG